jgi:rSAM/selenodomain-associated transferase 1
MKKREILGLTVKFPEPGRVKTRLAKDVGEETAADVYAFIARRVLGRTAAASAGYERMIFCSPRERIREFEEWFPGEKVIPQKGRSIGRIMQNALSALFAEGAAKAVVAGVDVPALGREIVRAAFVALDAADIVIGPAVDGGYYLIGMKSVHPGIFEDIHWSTDRVLEETLSATERAGLTVRLTERLYDVDTLEDLLLFLIGKEPEAGVETL